jgi:hypothetical protein
VNEYETTSPSSFANFSIAMRSVVAAALLARTVAFPRVAQLVEQVTRFLLAAREEDDPMVFVMSATAIYTGMRAVTDLGRSARPARSCLL